MLVLTREADQAIVIGDNIIVQVVEVDRGRVRLAIKAPRDVIINRAEVHERKMAERAEAERAAAQQAQARPG